MNKYQRAKENARNKVIRYQNKQLCLTWGGEMADIQGYFEKLGRRYGLLSEFRENGII